MVVIGNPDEVDEVAGSIRSDGVTNAINQSRRRRSFGRKGRIGEIGDGVPSLGAKQANDNGKSSVQVRGC